MQKGGALKLKDVKITVLETPLNQELVSRYGLPGTPACPNHRVGDTFLAPQGAKPDGICDEAWNSMSRYAFALASGARHFWDDWVVPEGVAVVTCADAFRPVVFKLEAVD